MDFEKRNVIKQKVFEKLEVKQFEIGRILNGNEIGLYNIKGMKNEMIYENMMMIQNSNLSIIMEDNLGLGTRMVDRIYQEKKQQLIICSNKDNNYYQKVIQCVQNGTHFLLEVDCIDSLILNLIDLKHPFNFNNIIFFQDKPIKVI